MYRNKYLNFKSSPPPAPYQGGPSYNVTQPYGNIRDISRDPRFQLDSEVPYEQEIITRATTFDYFRTSLLLPNPSEILKKLGRNIEEFDQLLADARVKACMNNRRAGTMSLKWSIDQNACPVEFFSLIKKIFDTYPLYDIMAELLLAPFYGYAIAEVNWETEDGLWVPKSVVGKATRWVAWDEQNELRYKTKVQMTQGEQLPPRKIITCRFNPTYQDPYSGNECLAGSCYWPVKFRHMTLQSAELYIKRYAMPWIDAQMTGTSTKPDRVDELIKALKAGSDDNVFIHPESTIVKLLNTSDSRTVENYTKYLDMLNREIDMVILGTNMGAEIKGGSFAAATALQGVRDDIIQSDTRMIENAFNTLIEWTAFYNLPAGTTLPKFKLYKHDPPTKDRAEIDVMLAKLGVKFDKRYIARAYGLNDDEFEIGAPIPELAPGMASKGGIAGTIDKPEEPAKPIDADIQKTGITAKDNAVNKSTTESIVANQQRGSAFKE